MIHYLPHLTRF